MCVSACAYVMVGSSSDRETLQMKYFLGLVWFLHAVAWPRSLNCLASLS
jgi:hypothetical protein